MSDPLNLVFGALADPNRRQVIGYLSERGTATATELTGELPMTRQAVSKHLATLADAGLVESERQGRERVDVANPRNRGPPNRCTHRSELCSERLGPGGAGVVVRRPVKDPGRR